MDVIRQDHHCVDFKRKAVARGRNRVAQNVDVVDKKRRAPAMQVDLKNQQPPAT